MKKRGLNSKPFGQTAKGALCSSLLLAFIVGLWTVASNRHSSAWFSAFQSLCVRHLSIITLLVAVWWKLTRHSGKNTPRGRSFLVSARFCLLAFAGLVVGLFPYLIPRHKPLWTRFTNVLAFSLPGIVILYAYASLHFLGDRLFAAKVEDYRRSTNV